MLRHKCPPSELRELIARGEFRYHQPPATTRFRRGCAGAGSCLIPPIPQWVHNLVAGMTSPFCSWTCLCLSLIWLQMSLINAALEFLRVGVPLQLVRRRELEEEERPIEGECTLGAISIRMFAF